MVNKMGPSVDLKFYVGQFLLGSIPILVLFQVSKSAFLFENMTENSRPTLPLQPLHCERKSVRRKVEQNY